MQTRPQSALTLIALLCLVWATTLRSLEGQPRNRSWTVVVPEGTPFQIRLLDTISSRQNKSDDYFDATLDKDLVINSEVVIPRKSRVTGKLLEVKDAGRVKGRARMELTLVEVVVRGVSHPIHTDKLVIEAEGSKGSDLKKIGGGAGLGALIGVIAGGGGGAVLGSVIGATSGTAGVLLTKGKHVTFGPEHSFMFRLKEDLEVQTN
ncbi:MAG: hypothetical protein ACE5JX_02340 [Acidobacteriota bacterium]